MMSNVIRLPRPRSQRPEPQAFGFFVRVGRNDHRELLHLISTGERGIFGFVIEARYIERQKDLIEEAGRKGFDVVLDPMTQHMGLVGGHRQDFARLPWGLNRHHNVVDFDDQAGRTRAAQIVEMAVKNGFTQILGPTHLLTGPNDPWLRRDINMMNWTAEYVRSGGPELGLIYSLALPMSILRRSQERRAIIAAIADASFDAIWLKVENFGSDATGEKMAAYIEACRDLHQFGCPLLGDHVGGLPGLGVLAFGAVGGIAHGVTLLESFRAASWRRPPELGGGPGGWRVYLPQLDMRLKPKAAELLFRASPRIKALCGCRDTHCCPRGVPDMVTHPARHAIYQRAREVEHLSAVPQSVRPADYLDNRVRKVSDDVARVAAFPGVDDSLLKALRRKQEEMSRMRQTIAHLVAGAGSASVAMAPSRRSEGKGS